MSSLQTRLGLFITAVGADIKTLTDSLFAVSDAAALNIFGGAEKVSIASQASGVLTINVADANVFATLPINANITSWSWQNLPSTGSCTITLFANMGTTLRTISTAFGGTVHWISPQPVHVVSKATVYTFITVNQGTDWYVSAVVES